MKKRLRPGGNGLASGAVARRASAREAASPPSFTSSGRARAGASVRSTAASTRKLQDVRGRHGAGAGRHDQRGGHFPRSAESVQRRRAHGARSPKSLPDDSLVRLEQLGRASSRSRRLGSRCSPAPATRISGASRWSEALDRAARAPRDTARGVVFYSSGRSSNEAAFLMQWRRAPGNAQRPQLLLLLPQRLERGARPVYGSGTRRSASTTSPQPTSHSSRARTRRATPSLVAHWSRSAARRRVIVVNRCASSVSSAFACLRLAESSLRLQRLESTSSPTSGDVAVSRRC